LGERNVNDEKTKDKKRYLVPALEKGLTLLEYMAKTNQALRITDIHEQLGIPKTTVFMLLSTLESMGYIEKVDENRYRATLKIYNLGMQVLEKNDVIGIARPYMEDLAERFRYTVHLAILSNDSAVYIEKVNGPSFVQFNTKVGQAMPLHCSAVGKALVAYLPEEQLKEMFSRKPLVRYTENTITNLEEFISHLAHVREQGYAVEDEEGESGIRCIGCPIFNNKLEVAAAMSVTAVRADLPAVRFHEVGMAIKEACDKISASLGAMLR